MKKWFVLLVALIVIFICIQFLLPAKIRVAHASVVPANSASIYRCLTNPVRLTRLLAETGTPEVNAAGDLSVKKGAYRFTFRPASFNIVEVLVEKDKKAISSFITVLPVGEDSTLLRWNAEWPAGSNPVQKIQQLLQSSAVKNEIGKIWKQMLDFLKKEENIYGLTIRHEVVTDTLLLTSKHTSTAYPGPELYYAMITKIREFMQKKGVAETNYPMLHIEKLKNGYETMVAVPVNKHIEGNGKIELKKMVKGKLLTTEVKGGPGMIDESFRQIEFYMLEKKLLSPAIPFQSLVTDRTVEADTTQWVTRLNYPVL
jgi:hypothetical protein